jgi:DNA-binding transcriptional MerR regulator
MENHSDFELPSPHEKLSYKFILDAANERAHSEVSTSEEKPAENCGSQIEMAPEPMVTEEAESEEGQTESIPREELNLPEGKKYFRIGEVSQLLRVEPYVLRYWENEFRSVRPVKSKSGQRVYARKDVETLHYIKHLLHVEKFSVKGAKKKLTEKRRETRPPVLEKRDQSLKAMVVDVKELIHLAKTDPGTF